MAYEYLRQLGDLAPKVIQQGLILMVKGLANLIKFLILVTKYLNLYRNSSS